MDGSCKELDTLLMTTLLCQTRFMMNVTEPLTGLFILRSKVRVQYVIGLVRDNFNRTSKAGLARFKHVNKTTRDHNAAVFP